MNLMKSKVTVFLMAISVLILFSPITGFALDPLDNVVEITCTGAVPSVYHYNITIEQGRTVIFRMNTTTCDTVFISGDSPIGNFTLRDATPQNSINFPNLGTYNYAVTDSTAPGDSTKTGCKVIVVTDHPTLSQWGIFILVLLILVTGVWLLIRQRLAHKGGLA